MGVLDYLTGKKADKEANPPPESTGSPLADRLLQQQESIRRGVRALQPTPPPQDKPKK